jgi:hypothetical protein
MAAMGVRACVRWCNHMLPRRFTGPAFRTKCLPVVLGKVGHKRNTTICELH